MPIFWLPCSHPKATDNCLSAGQAIVPGLGIKSISFDEVEENGVNGEVGRRAHEWEDVIVFDEERNELVAKVAIPPDHYDFFPLFHKYQL